MDNENTLRSHIIVSICLSSKFKTKTSTYRFTHFCQNLLELSSFKDATIILRGLLINDWVKLVVLIR